MSNGRDPKEFFSCKFGQTMSVAFHFAFMSRKATHAAFLMQYPTRQALRSKGKSVLKSANPDTDPDYPGRISLGTNRAVPFKPQKGNEAAEDHRIWELYSVCLATRLDGVRK